MRSKGRFARLLDNWPAKVISLFAAGLVFVFYQINRLEDRFISVPLSVTINDEFLPASQVPSSVRVTLRSESTKLFKIQEDDIRASIDLSGVGAEGVATVPVHIEKRGSALGVEPLQFLVEPPDVAVSLERKASRTVAVTPSFRGFLAPGYDLVSFEMDPPEVEVSGPAGAVARVQDVPTDFIELTGRSSDFTVNARLLKKDSLVSLGGVETVEFRAIVQKSVAVRGFEGLEIRMDGLPDQLTATAPLPLGSLSLRSNTLDVSGFQPAAGTLFVDLSQIRAPGTYVVQVQSSVPEGFRVERMEPKTVSVTVVARGKSQ